MMVPGPAQAAAVVALDDDSHVGEQRARYARRLDRMSEVFGSWLDVDIPSPDGAFYLWIDVDDGWTFAERLARVGGAIVSPGEFYGAVSDRYVRVAMVQPDDRIELVAARLGVA
jgi:aspartate/methionine/tyrosine aminotransferase